jgi:hypothetical protein
MMINNEAQLENAYKVLFEISDRIYAVKQTHSGSGLLLRLKGLEDDALRILDDVSRYKSLKKKGGRRPG